MHTGTPYRTERTMATKPTTELTAEPIIEYKNLLNQHGKITAGPVKKFYTLHASNDPRFRKRADTLNKVFELRQDLLQALID